MYSVNKNDNNILFTNDYISTVFQDRSLLSITVAGKMNCCTDLETIKYTTAFPHDKCIYNARYANVQDQATCGPVDTKFNENCANPLGSYYRNVSELHMLVDGTIQNILTAVYDVSVASELEALNTAVNTYLEGKGFNSTFTATVTTSPEDFITLDAQFINLPPNVIPSNIILANEETCYVDITFECDDGSVCIQEVAFMADFAADEVINVSVNGKIYTFSSPLTFFNSEEMIDEINAAIIADGGTTTVTFSEYLENPEQSGQFGAGIYTDDDLLDFVTWGDGENTFVANAVCIDTETPALECIYSTSVDTSITPVSGINAFLFYTDSSFSNPVSTESLTMEDLVELENEINNQIAGTLTISVDGDVVTFTISDAIEIPDKIIFEGGHEAAFRCGNLEYFSDVYRPDLVEFTTNGIKLTEDYLNGFKTGVYGFTITLETEDLIITEKFCLFEDKDLKCTIVDIKDSKDLVYAYSLYEALQLAQDCINCECEQSCIIYKELLDFLESIGYESRDCGC